MNAKDPVFFQQGTENSFFWWGEGKQLSLYCESFLGLSSFQEEEWTSLPESLLTYLAANKGRLLVSWNPYNYIPVGTYEDPSALSLHTPLLGWPPSVGGKNLKENIFWPTLYLINQTLSLQTTFEYHLVFKCQTESTLILLSCLPPIWSKLVLFS